MKPLVIKSVSAAMQLCCIYALYTPMIRSVSNAPFPFGRLILIYPAALLIHTVCFRVIRSRVWVSIIGKILSIAPAAILLYMLSGELPWSWLVSVSQAFMESAMITFKENFDKLAILITSMTLWFTGWRQAGTKADFSTIFGEFQMGFGTLFLILVLAHGLKINASELQLVTGIFFTLGLIGMILCRESEKSAADLRTLPAHSYLSYAVIGVILIFVMAALFMVIVRPETVETVIAAFQTAGKWLWAQFLKIVDFFMQLFPSSDSPSRSNMPTAAGGDNSNDYWILTDNLQAKEILRIIMGLFWAGFLLFCLWRLSLSFLEYIKNLKIPSQAISYETIHGGFKQDLISRIRQLRHKIKMRIRQVLLFLNRFLPLAALFPGRFPHVPVVQKIYTDLLRWSAKNGVKRDPCQTPSEHEVNLSSRAKEETFNFKTITFFYERYRYGGITPLPEKESFLEKIWQKTKKIRLIQAEKGETRHV